MAGKKASRPKKPRNEARLLIRTTDGALFNYTEALAKRSDMQLHKGSAPSDAQIAKATGKDPSEFDVGHATKGELIKFAKSEYGVELDPAMGLDMLRRQVVSLAQKAEEAEAAKQ